LRFENDEELDEFYPGYLNIEAAVDENVRIDLTKVDLDSPAVPDLFHDAVERERLLVAPAGSGYL
jgi:hypothetical protein